MFEDRRSLGVSATAVGLKKGGPFCCDIFGGVFVLMAFVFPSFWYTLEIYGPLGRLDLVKIHDDVDTSSVSLFFIILLRTGRFQDLVCALSTKPGTTLVRKM